ncbi:MAG: ABC transporter permease [Thermomicrobiales bacterium]|nr:ABC transporter permease [Thermomicrobiales bacterium]
MASALWRPLPVFMLTIRQFFGGKSVWVVAVLAFLPALFGMIYWFDSGDNPPAYFLAENIYRPLVIATLLPITVLILATGALGNEIEDATLPYLTLKPISRLRIVFEKLLATLVVSLPIILGGLLTTYLIVFRGDAGESESLSFLWALLASAAAGIVAYGAVFLLVSLFVARALLVGIVYALVWESLLGRFLTGLKIVSIRHYTESILVGMADDRDIALTGATGVATSVVVIVAVVIAAMLISTWRLRNLNLE